MRGYFGIGTEGISKPVNLGNLMRSAQAFGASFFFSVASELPIPARSHPTDTSRSAAQMPVYVWENVEEMALPAGCQLIGVELTDKAVDLPSFRHPARAAYVLGPERGTLSDAMLARCAHVVRIPAAFSLNLATAGAIVMYDRLRQSGAFAPRPVRPGAPAERRAHRFGGPYYRGGERVDR
jgi:tRNA G18 (ribose-2'-O)-methylase SpoU